VSKLADRIRRAGRVEPAPLGFAAAAARPKAATLLCLVRLNGNEANKAGEAAAKGADAVIVLGADAGKLKDASGKAGSEAVLGAGLEKADRQKVTAAREAGADFVTLDAQSAMADALLEEKVGFVLAVDGETDDTTLRLLGDLGLDGLVVPSPQGPLTLDGLLKLRRISALARTPMLTEVRADADASLLQALREAGVIGVIVDASGIGRLEPLRERIASLPARGRRKEERAEAVIPAGVTAAAGHDHEDDDDDE